MNSNSASVWDARLWRKRYTAVGAWKNGWWNWDSCGATSFLCVLPAVKTLLVQSFKNVDHEKALLHIVCAERELAMSKILPAIDLI